MFPPPSVGPALGNEFLTTKGQAAHAAFPGANEDCGAIDEHFKKGLGSREWGIARVRRNGNGASGDAPQGGTE